LLRIAIVIGSVLKGHTQLGSLNIFTNSKLQIWRIALEAPNQEVQGFDDPRLNPKIFEAKNCVREESH
jgi:hypothetical protein